MYIYYIQIFYGNQGSNALRLEKCSSELPGPRAELPIRDHCENYGNLWYFQPHLRTIDKGSLEEFCQGQFNRGWRRSNHPTHFLSLRSKFIPRRKFRISRGISEKWTRSYPYLCFSQSGGGLTGVQTRLDQGTQVLLFYPSP
jgi:hypothetical protein